MRTNYFKINLEKFIKNEKYEAINEILLYLKNKFNFKPKLITLDMARGPINSFIKSFNNINIYI